MAIATTSIVHEAAFRLGRDRDHQFERRKPSRTSEPPAEVSPRRRPGSALARRVAGTTTIMAVLTALALWAASFVADWFAGDELSGDETPVEVVVDDDILLVPGNAIRFAHQRRGGEQVRLDLRWKWPELSGFREGDETLFRSDRVEPKLIFATLEPRHMRLDMSARVEPIYSRFLEGMATDAGNGLIRQALAQSKGFVDEELYYEAASPHPYAVRCIRAASNAAAPYCLRDIHVGRGLSLTYRFHISLIDQWMEIEAAIRARAYEVLRR